MAGTNKGIVLRSFACIVALSAVLNICTPSSVMAEPLLLIYPNTATVFRYDPDCYEELPPSDPRYDPSYDIGGKMLWDKEEQRIPIEIYRAPRLNGFEVSPLSLNEFVTMSNRFDVIVDGFFTAPRQLSKLYLRIIPDPPQTTVQATVGGVPIDRLINPIPGFSVTTSIGGGFYSDTENVLVTWSGAVGMRITVYADKNGDCVYDDVVPRFSLYVIDNTIAVETETWGGIKALYGSK
jgi:hypothetical protein